MTPSIEKFGGLKKSREIRHEARMNGYCQSSTETAVVWGMKSWCSEVLWAWKVTVRELDMIAGVDASEALSANQFRFRIISGLFQRCSLPENLWTALKTKTFRAKNQRCLSPDFFRNSRFRAVQLGFPLTSFCCAFLSCLCWIFWDLSGATFSSWVLLRESTKLRNRKLPKLSITTWFSIVLCLVFCS